MTIYTAANEDAHDYLQISTPNQLSLGNDVLQFAFSNTAASTFLDDVLVANVPEVDPGASKVPLALAVGGLCLIADRRRRDIVETPIGDTMTGTSRMSKNTLRIHL